MEGFITDSNILYKQLASALSEIMEDLQRSFEKVFEDSVKHTIEEWTCKFGETRPKIVARFIEAYRLDCKEFLGIRMPHFQEDADIYHPDAVYLQMADDFQSRALIRGREMTLEEVTGFLAGDTTQDIVKIRSLTEANHFMRDKFLGDVKNTLALQATVEDDDHTKYIKLLHHM